MFSLCSFKEAYILISGGYGCDTTELYTCSSYSFSKAPPMNLDRHHHGTSELGDSVYAFGGFSYRNKKVLNSIEHINLQAVINGDTQAKWLMLDITAGEIHPRCNAQTSFSS